MKTRKSILSIFAILFVFSIAFAAQSPSPAYFEGKWAVLIKDTPQCSATIPMRFETVGAYC